MKKALHKLQITVYTEGPASTLFRNSYSINIYVKYKIQGVIVIDSVESKLLN